MAWRRIGIDEIRAARVGDLYTPEVRAEIAHATQFEDSAKANELVNRAVNVAPMLWAELHYRVRPRASQRRAALKKLRRRIDALLNDLENLDDDTRRELEIAADSDVDDPSREPPRKALEVTAGNHVFRELGDIRLNSAVVSTKSLI